MFNNLKQNVLGSCEDEQICENKCDFAHLREKKTVRYFNVTEVSFGGSGELQALQPDLGAR